MNIEQIKWTTVNAIGESEFNLDWTYLNGIVGNELLFFIEKKGKRNPKFILQSIPVRNSGYNPLMMFAPANNTKVLGKSHDHQEMKELAQKKLTDYLGIYVSYYGKEYWTLSEYNRFVELKNKLFGEHMFVVEEPSKQELWKEFEELRSKEKLWWQVKYDINANNPKQI